MVNSMRPPFLEGSYTLRYPFYVLELEIVPLQKKSNGSPV
jgi:hypothetical protein